MNRWSSVTLLVGEQKRGQSENQELAASFFQPATTCDPSEGPVRVARPLPRSAAATPWSDWSTGRIHGHSRFQTPDRVVH